jgi:hypothetical protein
MVHRHAARRSRRNLTALVAAYAAAALCLAAAAVFLPAAARSDPAPRAPLPVGVVVPALAHQRSAVITVRVRAGETIVIVSAAPRR